MFLVQQSLFVTSKTDGFAAPGPFLCRSLRARLNGGWIILPRATRLLFEIGLQTPRCLPPSRAAGIAWPSRTHERCFHQATARQLCRNAMLACSNGSAVGWNSCGNPKASEGVCPDSSGPEQGQRHLAASQRVGGYGQETPSERGTRALQSSIQIVNAAPDMDLHTSQRSLAPRVHKWPSTGIHLGSFDSNPAPATKSIAMGRPAHKFRAKIRNPPSPDSILGAAY